MSDSIVRVCEIKTSSRGVDVDKFAEVAKRLRPDVALLAVMEPQLGTSSNLSSRLTTALNGTGIAGEVMYLRDGDIEQSFTLPNGRGFTIRLL